VGECLARLRRESGLTQQQLADRSGVSRGLIRKLEQDVRTSARLPTLVALARALNVPVSALLDPSTSPGSLLRAARKRRGMTQSMLAARAGITSSHVSQLETGHRSLSHLPTVRALATALRVSPAELVPWLATGAPDLCICGQGSDAGEAVSSPERRSTG
jgi:transcriptional regulator with XRE-family HTH domain